MAGYDIVIELIPFVVGVIISVVYHREEPFYDSYVYLFKLLFVTIWVIVITAPFRFIWEWL